MIRGCFHIESGRGEEGAEGAAGSSVTGTGSLPSRGGFVDIEGVCIDIERGGRTSSAHVVDAAESAKVVRSNVTESIWSATALISTARPFSYMR